jgi:hypothetical protein
VFGLLGDQLWLRFRARVSVGWQSSVDLPCVLCVGWSLGSS